jgi:hypothetical protein
MRYRQNISLAYAFLNSWCMSSTARQYYFIPCQGRLLVLLSPMLFLLSFLLFFLQVLVTFVGNLDCHNGLSLELFTFFPHSFLLINANDN